MKKVVRILSFGFLLSLLLVLAASFLIKKDNSPLRFDKNIKRKKTISDKGLYITYHTTQNKKKFNLIKKQAKQAGLNTLVVDIKNQIKGQILPLLKEKRLSKKNIILPNKWLSKLISQLHNEGFIVVGRIIVFKDDHLAIARPDLAIRNPDGTLYRDHKRGRWVNPYKDEVRLYNQLIAEIAAKSGIDEIQYDYFRFPAEGSAYNIKLPQEKDLSRVDIINKFLSETKIRLAPYNTSIAVDIFGITAWQQEYDIKLLGQSLEAMAKYVDVICPMLYPSHFHSGYDGFANPGDHPYHFINTGVKKAVSMLKGSEAKLNPWIQGFALGTSWYGKDYIRAQIDACTDEGVSKFLIWNAANRYNSLPKQ